MTTAKKRRTLFAKLNPHKDSDLIGWLDALPHGQQNHAIKTAIREGLQLPYVDYSSPESNSELTALRDEVMQLRQALQQAQLDTAAALELQQMRQQMNTWSDWFAHDLQNYIRGQIDQVMIMPVAPSIEASPRAGR